MHSSNSNNIIKNSPFELIGQAACIRRIRELIDKYADSKAPVHIHGESGTGKEAIARLIHERGPRRLAPFIAVNCGAIPSELMESEFFGYTKGSFSGANQNKIGLFQAANHGILFLDEVADLPIQMQVKLLRVIQEKSVRPIGSAEEISLDVRILSATHRNCAELVLSGLFRQDLYYRLNVLELIAPSLRDHIEDIPLFAEEFLKRSALEHETIPSLSEEAIHVLQQYAFPGNVRELENCLERALILHENGVIQANDLQIPHALSLHITPSFTFQSMGQENLDEFLSRMEREKILSALESQQGNKSAAAKMLGITFRTLRYRLEKLGIG